MKIYNTQTLQLYTSAGKPYVGMWYQENMNYYQYPDIRPGTRNRLYTAQELNRNVVQSRTKMRVSSTTPMPAPVRPSEDDYLLGRFIRYFTQKRNSPYVSIVEVNKQTYDETLSPDRKAGINPVLYNSVAIPWYISGPRDYVVLANTRNLSTVESVFPGISSYLSDPVQFYRPGVGDF